MSQTPAPEVHVVCSVCGYAGGFALENASIREGYACPRCRSTLRYREQAAALLGIYADGTASTLKVLARSGRLDGLRIYEPGLIGPFRALFQPLPHYEQSYFWPAVEPGAVKDGIPCQTLERLTYDDNSFDLVVSSDIFEHVARPWIAFAEVNRVLAPGGRHIFTVPIDWHAATQTRVEVQDGEECEVMPARYHGSPTDPSGSLVYTDYGWDLADILTARGYPTAFRHGWPGVASVVSTKAVES